MCNSRRQYFYSMRRFKMSLQFLMSIQFIIIFEPRNVQYIKIYNFNNIPKKKIPTTIDLRHRNDSDYANERTVKERFTDYLTIKFLQYFRWYYKCSKRIQRALLVFKNKELQRQQVSKPKLKLTEYNKYVVLKINAIKELVYHLTVLICQKWLWKSNYSRFRSMWACWNQTYLST